MTVETLPDIEALVNSAVRKPCEIWLHDGRGGKSLCRQPANWVAHARFTGGCRFTVTRLICDVCRPHVVAGIRCCERHRDRGHVTWIERGRS